MAAPVESAEEKKVADALRAEAGNRNALRGLEDSSRMWSYVFDLSSFEKGPPPYLQHFPGVSAHDWRQIGWGRDRDIGSADILVHVRTGVLAEYFDCQFYPAEFSVFNATIFEIFKLGNAMDASYMREFRIEEILRTKLRERKQTFHPLFPHTVPEDETKQTEEPPVAAPPTPPKKKTKAAAPNDVAASVPVSNYWEALSR